MNFKNAICRKFERLVNDEIAAGQHHDYILVDGLQQYEITGNTKEFYGVPVETPLTLYDVTKPSVDILKKLRLEAAQ